ncbi:MAG: LLM class flavin-dependent oxidoreductase [Salinirussus sp.]
MSDVEFATVGPQQPPADRFARSVERIGEKGWDTIWWPDHYMGWYPNAIWTADLIETVERQPSPHPFFETLTTLGYAAAVTDDVSLGVAATDPIRRHPITLAQAFHTLHHFTDGRARLVLGAGERENTEPYGMDYAYQVSKLEEALEIIDLAWDGTVTDTFDYDGEFWQLRDAAYGLEPLEGADVAPYPEIWLGAHSPRMLSLTGRFADGWLPITVAVPDYPSAWEQIADAAIDAGRDPEEITQGAYMNLVIAEDTETCRDLLDTLTLRLNCLFLPASFFERYGYEHPLGADFGGLTEYVPTRLDRETALEAARAVPQAVLEERYVWGSPDDVVAEIEQYVDEGAEHVALVNQTFLADPDRTGASFALLDEVRSRF